MKRKNYIDIYISLFFCIFIGFHRKFLGHVVTRKAIIRRASLFNEAFQSYKRSFFDWPLLYFISLGAKRENVSSKYDRVQETSHAKFIFHFFLFKKRHVAGIVQWTFRTEENRIFLFLSLSLFFPFSLLVVVEIGVQRSVQMAVRDKKNFARIYRYWPIVIDAPPFPVQMGKIVFPFFFFLFLFSPSFFRNRKREREKSFNISAA